MERESFEDEEVADILNNHFISVKVDREERPDIDQIYMTFCQAISGNGGWPMTTLMTPEKRPFLAGTYFPKESRHGLPGLVQLLQDVAKMWEQQRDTVIRAADDLTAYVIENHLDFSSGELTSNVIDGSYTSMEEYFDQTYGGFGNAPKFPTPHNLTFLLKYYAVKGEKKALDMVEKTLEHMYRGGIFDHIGFGFSRYSTDRKWLVPHFEKMLYDNALLAIAYLETYRATKKSLYAEVAKKIFTYILRDMTSPEGGFYTAEDADSEGVEGKFYLWSPDEVRTVLGAQAGNKYCLLYDITEKGNFEGSNIPNLINAKLDDLYNLDNKDSMTIEELDELRRKLFNVREKRVHPFKDDKILTGWNGLMVAALAIGARVLDNSSYLSAAEKSVEFITNKLIREDGRLLARYRDGEAAFNAYLDDYAFLVWGLIELYESAKKQEHLEKALALNGDMLSLFWDKHWGGLYLTGKDSEDMLIRPKEIYDGAVPSGNSVAALNLLRLGSMTGDRSLEEKAHQVFYAFGGEIGQESMSYSFILQAFMYSQFTIQ